MIKLENVTKAFETPAGTVVAADHINMEVAEGEICVLLGSLGLRQDDDAEDDQPAGRAHVRQDLHRRQGHRCLRSGRAAAHDRLCDPADRAVPAT